MCRLQISIQHIHVCGCFITPFPPLTVNRDLLSCQESDESDSESVQSQVMEIHQRPQAEEQQQQMEEEEESAEEADVTVVYNSPQQ